MIERLSTQEAAQRLGISPATVRRKIATGELTAEREARPQGARWWVLLDASANASPERMARVKRTNHDQQAITLLMDEVADLRRRLDASENAQAELRQLLGREQERWRVLRVAEAETAQPSFQATDHETRRDVSAMSADSPPAPRVRRPWYAFWKSR